MIDSTTTVGLLSLVTRGRVVSVVLAGALALGCGGGQPPAEEEPETAGDEMAVAEPEPEPEPQPPAASPVTVIHAAAGQLDTPLAGNASGAAPAQVAETAYASASAYAPFQPGVGETAVTLSLTAGALTLEHPMELAANTPSTVVVFTSAEDPAQLAALTVPGERGAVAGQARGRFVNAMMGSEAIDLCLPGGTPREAGRPIFSNVAYGQAGGIPSFPSLYQPMTLAGVDAVQVRTANAENPCSGRVLGTAPLPPIDINAAHNLTIVAIGNTRARPRAPKQLLICEDAPGPGACAAVPMR